MNKEKKLYLLLISILFFFSACSLTFFYFYPLDILNHKRYLNIKHFIDSQQDKVRIENDIIWNISQYRKKMEMAVTIIPFLFLIYIITILFLYLFSSFYFFGDNNIKKFYFTKKKIIKKINNILLIITAIYDFLSFVDIFFFLFAGYRLWEKLKKISNEQIAYRSLGIAWEYINYPKRCFFLIHFFLNIFSNVIVYFYQSYDFVI